MNIAFYTIVPRFDESDVSGKEWMQVYKIGTANDNTFSTFSFD
jgi:hypothetical protein